MKKLKLPFSEVWILNLAERKDRLKDMQNQLKYFGIENDVRYHIGVKHPFSDDIANFFRTYKNMYLANGGAFNCTWEHYTIIKKAYLNNVNTIMVMEDDCKLYNDITVLQKYFDSLPDDWDILRIAPLRGREEQKYFFNYPDDTMWVKQFSSMWGTGSYALNRKGMEYMLKCIEQYMQPIDSPLFYANAYCSDINVYVPNLPIGLCISEDSDIVLNNPNLSYKDIVGLDYNKYKY